MDILKIAIDWAKVEALSASAFIVFAITFLLASLGFWQFGKTEMSRAYVIPTLVAGLLLLGLGLGLVVPNLARISGTAEAFNTDATGFVASELARVDKTMADYSVAVFKVMPMIIIVCAVLLIVLDSPAWRAASITAITSIAITMLVDTNANARLEVYKAQLQQWERQK